MARLLRVVLGAALVSAILQVTAPTSAQAQVQTQPRWAKVKCTIVGTNGDDVLVGTPGPDVICGRGGDDKIRGRGGDDILKGGSGNDLVRGGGGDDKITGGRGNDRLFGQRGDDVVRGDAGKDQVNGGPGNDQLGGFRGRDKLDATDSNQFRDVVRCGPGPDKVTADTPDVVRPDCEQVTQNLAPATVDDTFTTIEDTTLDLPTSGSGSPAENDTDPDGDPLIVTSVSGASGGSVSLAGSTITFVPDANLCGTGAGGFDYEVSDGQGGTRSGAVSIDITCVDDQSSAVDDDATLTEDDPATAIAVLDNDSDVEGDPITILSVTQPANGEAVITGGGTGLTYQPDADYCNDPGGSEDTFTYTISGGDGATVSVTVACVNDDPVAVDDTGTTDEDTALDIPVADLLTNDDDVDGDTLSVTSVQNPAHGSVALVSTTVTFTPAADFCGDASFDYTLSDGKGGTDTGAVDVTVTCVNDAPVAVDDPVTVDEDSGVTPIDVLTNDTDVESDAITVTGVTQPDNGTATFTAGNVSYEPDADYCNDPGGSDDTFTYTINGGDTGSVDVTVTCLNDAPVLDLDTGAAGTGSSVTFIESDPHSGDGVLIAPDASVTDVDDATMASATVTLTNRPDGDAFESLSAIIPGGSGITGGTYVPATGVLAFTGTASKSDYAAVIASIKYDNTVNPPDAADRTITVVLNDGVDDSNSATATVSLTLLNEAPEVDLDSGTAGNDASASFTENAGPAGLVPAATITDADDTNLASATITLTDAPDGNAETLSADGGATGVTVNYNAGTRVLTLSGDTTVAEYQDVLRTLTYNNTSDTPDTTDRSVTVVVNDGQANSVERTVTVSVGEANDPPVNTVPGAQSTDEDTSKAIAGISVADPDNASLTVTVDVDHGVLTMSTLTGLTFTTGDGTDDATMTFSGTKAALNTALATLSYDPASDYHGSDTLTVGTTDGTATDTDTVAITVGPVNDPPVNTVPGTQSVDEDTALVFNTANSNLISVADVDAGSDDLRVTLTGSNGTVTLSGIAGLSFTVGDGTSDATMTFDGTLSAINTALDGLSFTGTADFSGSASLQITTSDLGHSGSGGVKTDTDTIDITVNAVNDPPTADDESFTGAGNRAIGNTLLVVNDPTDGAPAASGPKRTITGDILAGDTDPDGPNALAVVAETVSTNDGGSVTLEADGDFVYTPKTGTSCTDHSDFFDYTVTDGNTPTAGTDTGRVTIEITDCVWYVDAAASSGGDGSSGSPFDTLAPLSGAGDVDAIGDTLFLYGGGAFSTGLVLEQNQSLIGQPHGLTKDSAVLVPAAGTNPTISNTAGDGLTLAPGTSIQGINLASTPAVDAALVGTSVGTATMNTLTPGIINNATGGAVDISGGTLSMAFASVSSANAIGDGIRLDNTAGTFTASGGALVSAGGQDVDITGNNTGDTIDFTFGGTITDDQGTLVNVSNQSGGTKDFNGAITDGDDGDGNGVSLTNNTGATVRFDGGLILSTGANSAFTATGGGTVVATQNNTSIVNSVTTTTGVALNVANTTIGSDGLTFRRISANGGVNGIVLNTTGSVGGLSVTGNGGTCSSVGNCTGGAISSTTGDGVKLDTVQGGVSLTRMIVTGTGDDGIDASGVKNLAIASSSILNNGNAVNEEGISLVDSTGSLSITGTTVTGSAYNNLRLENSAGTLTSLALTDSKFNANSQVTGNHGVLIDLSATAAITTASVTGSEFKDNASIGIQVAVNGGASVSGFTIDNNTFSGTSTGPTTGTQEIAIDMAKSGTSNLTFAITNNSGILGHNSHGINLFSGSGAGTGGLFRGRVTGNTIGSAGAASSGSQIGNCMRVNLNGDSTDTVLIDNNVLRQCPNGRGIEVIGRNGTGVKDVTVTNNDVNTNDVSGFPLAGILVQSNCVSVCATVRADVRGNTVLMPATAFDYTDAYLELVESGASTLLLVDTPPASASCAAQLADTNTGSTSASAGCALIAGPIGTPP